MQSNKPRFNEVEQAILETIIYSDIFNFPLTKSELWKYLISQDKISRDSFEKTLSELTSSEKFEIYNYKKKLSFKDGYFFLIGKEEIIQKRKRNKQEVQKKVQIAKKAIHYLALIPSIRFIGISGGLALGNVEKNDDIDFFVITKRNSLFVTRFLILALLEALNLRRKRKEKNPSNKICVNMLIDENNLSWAIEDQDLYIAHEIIQMRPFFERNDMYKKFLNQNNWVKKFFPNFNKRQYPSVENKQANYLILQTISFFITLWPFEFFLKKLQDHYMKKHKTTETVSKALIAFHPNDYKIKTMKILRSKYEKLGLLTNI